LAIAAGTTLTRSGPGTLTISGTQNHGAGAIFNATAGTTNINSDAGPNLAVNANAR
jgi:autotransporter-associated beta strand protein